MRFFILIISLAFVSNCLAQMDRQYMVVHKTSSEILVDGKASEASWQAVEYSQNFVDIEGELKMKPIHDTRMKMLWDEDYLYAFRRRFA